MVVDSFLELIGVLILGYICIILVSNVILLFSGYITCLADKYFGEEVINEYLETKKYKHDESPILLEDIVFIYNKDPWETIFFFSIMGILMLLLVFFILVFYIIRFVSVYIKIQAETNVTNPNILRYVHNFVPTSREFFVKLWDKVKNTRIG